MKIFPIICRGRNTFLLQESEIGGLKDANPDLEDCNNFYDRARRRAHFET